MYQPETYLSQIHSPVRAARAMEFKNEEVLLAAAITLAAAPAFAEIDPIVIYKTSPLEQMIDKLLKRLLSLPENRSKPAVCRA